MDIIWLHAAENDLINYKQFSSIITNGKVENYIKNLLNYVDFLKTLPYLGKIFFHYKDSRNIDFMIVYLIQFFNKA